MRARRAIKGGQQRSVTVTGGLLAAQVEAVVLEDQTDLQQEVRSSDLLGSTSQTPLLLVA